MSGVTVTLRIGDQDLVAQLDEDAVAAIAAVVVPQAERWPEWMSIETAARYLDCSPERLRKLKERGRIPFSQEGKGCRVLFERAELDRWLRDQTDGRRR